MQRFAILVSLFILLFAVACGGSSNPGAVFDPTPPGSGSGGGGGGGGSTKGPSAAAIPGALSLSGLPSTSDVAPQGQTVAVRSPICVTFNESVQAATVTNTTLIVRVQQGQTIPLSISNFGGGRFFLLIPTNPLPANKTIEIVASNLIRDLDGNSLVVPTGGIIGTFKTEATADATKIPSVVAVFPPDGSKNISPGTATFGAGAGAFPGTPTQIITVFNRPIAASTILGDLTPPLTPEKVGLTLIEDFDPDGAGPQPKVTKNLIPGTGAVLLPSNENRVWIATPLVPLDPGSTVGLAVGPGVKGDDVQPQSLAPPFTASFTVAAIQAPQFTNIDITPETASELAVAPALLNNVPLLPNNSANPTYAGKFTIGVVFGAGSLATDTVEIQMHDAAGTGNILFSKKARVGAGQSNYSDLTIFDSKGKSKLGQGPVVIAARVKRGSIISPWTLGPPILIDTVLPEIKTIGPPAEGSTLLANARTSSIYGTTSEPAFSVAMTQIESPIGTLILPPLPAGTSGHLLTTNVNFFQTLPLIPAPPIDTPASVGTPPVEPKAKAKVIVADTVGNSSPAQDINVIFRGRIGGPSLVSQQALTVVVYDEDTLVTVANAVVLVDALAPSGTSTSQTVKSVSLSTTTGATEATFLAGTDYSALATKLTITAAAPNYDITTFVGVPASFISIPIRKTRGGTTFDPSIAVTLSGAQAGATVDLLLSARPDLADRFTSTSTLSLGGSPVFSATTVSALRPLHLTAFVRNATNFTYLNDATNFPVAPIALNAVSGLTSVFGQSYSQTTDTSDDPISVPPGGGVNVTLPGAPFDASTATVESALFTSGARLGVNGLVGIGEGRNSTISGVSTVVAINFNPKANDQFFTVDPLQNPPFGTIVSSPIDPNSAPTDARVEVRAEDSVGRITRTLSRSATTGGALAAMTLPNIPETLAPQSSATISKNSPKIFWTDTAASSDGFYIIHLRMKQSSPVREWRIYIPRANADTSVPTQASLQLPSLTAFGASAGSPIPASASLVDQFVDAIVQQGLDFNDFFFEDLRAGQPDPNFEGDVTFARGLKAEIIY